MEGFLLSIKARALRVIKFIRYAECHQWIYHMYQSVITRGDMYLRREVDRSKQGSNVLNVPVSDYLLVIAQGSLCSHHTQHFRGRTHGPSSRRSS